MPGGRCVSWPDRWRAFRNRRLADPAFQARAIANPLLRPMARRHARSTFDLCAGFVYSQVVLGCVRLGVLDALRAGSLAPAELARRTGLQVGAALRLLRAATPLGLVEHDHHADRYGLGPEGACLLGNPAALAMVAHHEMLYADLADPVALLRGEREGVRLPGFWAYPDGDAVESAAAARAYSRLMSESQALVHQTVLGRLDLRGTRHLLDVGGGEGLFAIAAARRHPHLRCTVFDLPGVAALARERIAREGLQSRIDVQDGDFRRDDLPPGADCVSFVRVLHDHDEAVVRHLLRLAHRALASGGRVVVAEPLAGEQSAPRVGDTYFGFYLLAMGQGSPRTAAAYESLLAAAGFQAPARQATALPLASGLVTAIRPPPGVHSA